MPQGLHQWWVLCGRNFRVVASDRLGFLMTALQAPLIALVTLAAFNGLGSDERTADYFCRVVHHFRQLKAPYEARGDTVPLYGEIIQATQQAVSRETRLISTAAAQRRAGLYFVLVSAAVWIGVMGACREIVAEKDVLLREFRTCTRVGPYLAAKFTVQCLLTGAQTAVLASVVGLGLLEAPGVSWAALWGALWLTALASAALGLFVSSTCSTTRVALTIVPVLMVPQLLLGGLMRPPAEWSGEHRVRALCERIIVQRWGLEAAVATDAYADNGVVSVQFSSWDRLSGRYGELNLLTTSETGMRALLFQPAGPGRDQAVLPSGGNPSASTPVYALCLICGVLLAGCYGLLRLRFLPRGR